MKRSELKRKTPLRQGVSQMKRSPIARGTSTLKTTTALKSSTPMRTRKPAKDKQKRVARNAGPVDYLALCRGQPCYLLVPGVTHHPPDTVVPCHSNSLERGKGMGIKALDIYTVPGCATCHFHLDQGKSLDKEQRRAIWEAAYVRWEIARARMLGAGQEDPPSSGSVAE